MKDMYKNGAYKAVHTCHIDSMLKDGWSLKPSAKPVENKENLTNTHEQALELGLEIYDGDKLIHHKTLAKRIKEALANGDKDEG